MNDVWPFCSYKLNTLKNAWCWSVSVCSQMMQTCISIHKYKQCIVAFVLYEHHIVQLINLANMSLERVAYWSQAPHRNFICFLVSSGTCQASSFQLLHPYSCHSISLCSGTFTMATCYGNWYIKEENILFTIHNKMWTSCSKLWRKVVWWFSFFDSLWCKIFPPVGLFYFISMHKISSSDLL